MGRATVLVLVILVAGGTAGCGDDPGVGPGGSGEPTAEDERFLERLRTRDPMFDGADPAGLIATGHAVCEQLDQGVPADATPDDWTPQQAEAFTQAAISNYCRQHLSQ